FWFNKPIQPRLPSSRCQNNENSRPLRSRRQERQGEESAHEQPFLQQPRPFASLRLGVRPKPSSSTNPFRCPLCFLASAGGQPFVQHPRPFAALRLAIAVEQELGEGAQRDGAFTKRLQGGEGSAGQSRGDAP